MPLPQLLALLKDRALFFPRADKLGDPFEGAKGYLERKPIWDQFYLQVFEQAIRNPPEGFTCTLTEMEIKKECCRLLEDMAKGGKEALTHTYVSCWHENSHESEALWWRYGGIEGQSVAIRTRFSALQRALGEDAGIAIGRVQYVDFGEAFAGVNDAFFRKRRSFEHEKEVRAVIQVFADDAPQNGILRPVNLELLQCEVYVSPFSPDWYLDVVSEALARFGWKGEAIRSGLAKEPFY